MSTVAVTQHAARNTQHTGRETQDARRSEIKNKKEGGHATGAPPSQLCLVFHDGVGTGERHVFGGGDVPCMKHWKSRKKKYPRAPILCVRTEPRRGRAGHAGETTGENQQRNTDYKGSKDTHCRNTGERCKSSGSTGGGITHGTRQLRLSPNALPARGPLTAPKAINLHRVASRRSRGGRGGIAHHSSFIVYRLSVIVWGSGGGTHRHVSARAIPGTRAREPEKQVSNPRTRSADTATAQHSTVRRQRQKRGRRHPSIYIDTHTRSGDGRTMIVAHVEHRSI